MIPEDLVRRYDIHALYHFTDDSNLESIRQNGLLSLDTLDARGIEVPRPGGNEWSHDADRRKGLHRFVHLSLMDRHPMSYRAEQEGRIGPYSVLFISPAVLSLPGVRFTLDISNRADVELLDFSDWYDRVDLEVVYSRMDWRVPAIQERVQQAKRAEVLVPGHIPVELIQRGL